jgi:hypothetical protein
MTSLLVAQRTAEVGPAPLPTGILPTPMDKLLSTFGGGGAEDAPDRDVIADFRNCAPGIRWELGTADHATSVCEIERAPKECDRGWLLLGIGGAVVDPPLPIDLKILEPNPKGEAPVRHLCQVLRRGDLLGYVCDEDDPTSRAIPSPLPPPASGATVRIFNGEVTTFLKWQARKA